MNRSKGGQTTSVLSICTTDRDYNQAVSINHQVISIIFYIPFDLV